MSRILKTVLGLYLVLCLGLAGAVGTSPLLHQWLEHGGEGKAHVHQGSVSTGHYHHDEREPHSHPHPHSAGASRDALKERLVRHGGAFELPDLTRLGRMVGLLLPLRPISDSEQGGDHEHHSLPQLIAAGLVEHVEAPTLTVFFSLGQYHQVMTENFFPAPSPCNAQACPRGPPSVCI